MDLQYASDLHIDHFPGQDFSTFLIPSASVLLLAGDICSAWKPEYSRFIHWCASLWRYVILISGNHEYTCERSPRTMDETDAEIRRITAPYTNVKFLQNGESTVIPGTDIRVIGATLWSAVDPAVYEEVVRVKGDYKHTFTNTAMGIRTTTPMDICALHLYQKAMLHSAMASSAERVVLMVHHMPSFSFMEPSRRAERFATCYASADDDLFQHEQIAVVLCGHSHQFLRVRLPTGAVGIMNARGYKSEAQRLLHAYSASATIRV